MTVKALISDLDGTLIRDDNSIVPGYDEALAQLKSMGIKLVIFSNHPRHDVENKIKNLAMPPDLIVTRDDVNISKGSPEWIKHVTQKIGLKRNELLYIGDTDLDMKTAVNSKVIYFNAEWSNPGYKYGLPIESPILLPIIIKNFFLKKHLWYWSVDSKDLKGNAVISRALIKKRDIGVGSFKDDLLDWAKYEKESKLGSLTMSEFVFYHIIGSLYLDDSFSQIDTIALIPGHAGDYNPLIQNSMGRMARLFRETFIPDLLHRYKAAAKSSFARTSGKSPGFQNQVSTMHLNCEPKFRSKAIENKTIFIMDDFITEGFTTEWARNLLYNANAKMVIAGAIGAFHSAIEIQNIDNSIKWDSYSPVDIDAKYIHSQIVFGKEDTDALDEVANSYKEVGGT